MKLFILDSMEIANRCYFRDRDNFLESTKSYLDSVFAMRPDYIVAATDPAGALMRHSLFPEYKGNRPEKEEYFVKQLPAFFELFEAYGINVVKKNMYEADDVIGSIAHQWKGQADIYIVSVDKDMMQLVCDGVSILRPNHPNFDLITRNEVVAKLGVNPEQVVDYLAIVGDSADNIPGVKGVGAKGAEKLIKSHGSLLSILNSAPSDKPHMKVHESGQSAMLSKSLATIVTDLDIPISLNDCLFKGIDSEKVDAVLLKYKRSNEAPDY